MNHHHEGRDLSLLRFGAACGVLGVLAAVTQSAIDPHYSDDPGVAIRQASLSHFLTFSRVLDLTAFLLMLIGVTTITRVLSSGSGAAWARVAQTLFIVAAAAGGIATMIVGSFPDIADSWAEATPALQPGYVAVYDALGNVSGGVFAVSWTALGLFGIAYAGAVRHSDVFSRKLRWVAAASGISLISAMVVGIGFQVPVAFALLILGLLLSYVVIVASSVTVWRIAHASGREVPIGASVAA